MFIIYRLLQPCFSCTDWLILHLQFWKLATVELLGSLYVSRDKIPVWCQLGENYSCLPLACADKE